MELLDIMNKLEEEETRQAVAAWVEWFRDNQDRFRGNPDMFRERIDEMPFCIGKELKFSMALPMRIVKR